MDAKLTVRPRILSYPQLVQINYVSRNIKDSQKWKNILSQMNLHRSKNALARQSDYQHGLGISYRPQSDKVFLLGDI